MRLSEIANVVRRREMICRFGNLLVFLLTLVAVPAFARTLHWSSFDVQARLDADGRLQVVERQAIVFDGDWNGGERRFFVRAGQSLQFESVKRLEEGGAERTLEPGDLSAIDSWQMLPEHVVRWRSRLPDDPPFDNKEIVYLLSYTLSGVLRERDGRYLLAHDFAFPDREGEFAGFSLHFELDPVWRGLASPVEVKRGAIAPGQGVVVRGELTHHGAAGPGAVVHTLPPVVGFGFGTFLFVALAFLVWRFYRGERAVGRLGPIEDGGPVDDAWLATHLFSLAPEVAAAALKGSVGPLSVAAMLARLTQEGKLSSRVDREGALRRPVLHLRLEKPIETFEHEELKLVRALFVTGAKETDTAAIRKKYEGRGFDPAKLIRKPIESALGKLPGWNAGKTRASWQKDLLLFVGALGLLVAAGYLGNENDVSAVASLGFLSVFLGTAAVIGANLVRPAITGLSWRFGSIALLLAPLVLWVADDCFKASGYLIRVPTLVAACAYVLAIVNLTLDLLRSSESPRRLAARRRIGIAREHFAREFRSHAPRLQDAWYPWFLALGLGGSVERWFKAYGAEGAATATTGTLSGSRSGSSANPGGSTSFSGGGGTFGGAGASGGWAAAAVGIAAGVSAPGSSSGGSSSSGGGGGSSSGGGGGGGW